MNNPPTVPRLSFLHPSPHPFVSFWSQRMLTFEWQTFGLSHATEQSFLSSRAIRSVTLQFTDKTLNRNYNVGQEVRKIHYAPIELGAEFNIF